MESMCGCALRSALVSSFDLYDERCGGTFFIAAQYAHCNIKERDLEGVLYCFNNNLG